MESRGYRHDFSLTLHKIPGQSAGNALLHAIWRALSTVAKTNQR